jgi:hypothetical protein
MFFGIILSFVLSWNLTLLGLFLMPAAIPFKIWDVANSEAMKERYRHTFHPHLASSFLLLISTYPSFCPPGTACLLFSMQFFVALFPSRID